MEKLKKDLFQDKDLESAKKVHSGWCISGGGVTRCANGMTDVGF